MAERLPVVSLCAAAGLQRDVPEVWQLEESEGGQLLRPESNTVPGALPQHPAARVAAGRGHHYGENSLNEMPGLDCWSSPVILADFTIRE